VTALFLVLSCLSCGIGSQDRGANEPVIVPPPTPPLSRPLIGYGVISASYTHVVVEPNQAGLSLGYLRKGSIVEVLDRRLVNNGGVTESWVFVGGTYQGWLPENVIQVYDNMAKARTASESLAQ
jgi:hypothetical protein